MNPVNTYSLHKEPKSIKNSNQNLKHKEMCIIQPTRVEVEEGEELSTIQKQLNS
jgi:hypothetical protein